VIDPASLRSRLEGIRSRIANAARRAGRDPASVRLIAVSKTFSAAHVQAVADAGQVDFGESKVQEAQAKIEAVSHPGLRWHLIGHLQSNKARKAAGLFQVIHAVDAPSLIAPLDSAAEAAGHQVDLLIQVDLANEPTKHGARPEMLRAIFEAAQRARATRITGLMLLPPAVEDSEQARPYFAAVRQLRDDLQRQGLAATPLTELSMGMSHDFEVAIEEGATMVRVGSAIFGDRPPA
jgi:pyridoxal phosphate enzyme (YggS family)